jgi:FAD/FMN-containing dehydrogenase
LISKLPEHVFLGKSGAFSIWDAKQDVTPACRVEPGSAEDVKIILNTVKKEKCHFAIKSGGHSRFKGASNAEGGVTIDLVRLNQIELSADKKSVFLGAGLRWAEVYSALEADGLTVLGGRVATVGVGGILLGGSLLSNLFNGSRLTCHRWHLVLLRPTRVGM